MQNKAKVYLHRWKVRETFPTNMYVNCVNVSSLQSQNQAHTHTRIKYNIHPNMRNDPTILRHVRTKANTIFIALFKTGANINIS